MNDIISSEEKVYLDYIKNNKDFLKEFHDIYYVGLKKRLEVYRLSDYMITSYVKANKITGYNNYNEFIDKYLLQLSADKSEAIEVYNSFYDCFIENMSEYIFPLKGKFNKSDDDIYTAYEIKTVWQFYTGFLNEKVLRYYLDYNSVYTVADRSLEDKRYIDSTYALDIEAIAPTGRIIAIQCKSYTYLNISEDKKLIHINKHLEYTNTYDNSNTYYMLHQDYKPCYYIKDNKPCYLIRSNDILNLAPNDLKTGTYEEMILQIEKGDK